MNWMNMSHRCTQCIVLVVFTFLVVHLANTQQVNKDVATIDPPTTSSSVVHRHRHRHHHHHHVHNHTAQHRGHRNQQRRRRRLRLLEKLLNETDCGQRLKCLDRKIDRLMDEHGHRKRSHHHHHRQECDLCPPGQYMLAMCRPQSDTQCALCPLSTFQEHNNVASSCEKCSLCGQSLYEAHACTPTSDTVCDSCFTQRSSYSPDYYVKCASGQRPPMSSTRGDLLA